MSDILKKICDVKVQEVAAAKKATSLAEVRRDAESRVSTRDFVGAIRAKIAQGQAGPKPLQIAPIGSSANPRPAAVTAIGCSQSLCVKAAHSTTSTGRAYPSGQVHLARVQLDGIITAMEVDHGDE